MNSRLVEIADNMPGEGGIHRFMVNRDDLLAALEAAYQQGLSDGRRGASVIQSRCGVINPRTGMICSEPPGHPGDKHWTEAEDGQRYDWYVNA